MTATLLSTIIDGVIGLAVVVAGTVLLALGKVDGTTGVTLIGAGILATKGATTAALALKVPTSTTGSSGGA